MTRSRTWPGSTWCPEISCQRGEAGPAEAGRRWHCENVWGLPCSDGSRCCVVDTEQDSAGCIPVRRIFRTAGTGLAVAAVVVAAAACTFVVVFSAVAAAPTFADVSTVPAAVPTVAVVLFVVVVSFWCCFGLCC